MARRSRRTREAELKRMLRSSPQAFRARILAGRDKALDCAANAAASGRRCAALWRKYVRATSFSRTSQPFALAAWRSSSGSSLRSGMMRSGTVYPLPTLAPLTFATGSGLWPTLCASAAKGAGPIKGPSQLDGLRRGFLRSYVQEVLGVAGQMSPAWLEWFMGYRIGHVTSERSVTRSYRRRRS